MRDLTQGSVPRLLVAMAMPILAGMLLQTLYYIVDLYFVAQLGEAAIAGVSAAGNANVAVFSLTQILSVGVVSLMSQAAGRKDRAEANHVFNQALAISLLCATLAVLSGVALVDWYMLSLSGDAAAQAAGHSFFIAFLPGLALQFPLVAMSSALRATGVVKPTMAISVLTLLLNIALAPVLIAGWGTGIPLGVFGAGLASTIAVGAGLVIMVIYFHKIEKFVFADRKLMTPQWALWRRMILVGLPAGGEFALMFCYFTVIYLCLRHVGPTAQAGFGVGSRVMQSIFLPALAIAFAAAPVVGQNFGARLGARVRQTFRTAAWISSLLMLVLSAVCIGMPDMLIRVLTQDAAVVAFAADFLRVVALNFLANGIIFTCSSVFQGLGNTWPALIASGLRMFTFVAPALWMSSQPWFMPRHLWWLSVATVTGQALMCLWLVRRELAQRLAFPAAAGYQPIA